MKLIQLESNSSYGKEFYLFFLKFKGWVKYYLTHVFPTGWHSIASAFRIWKDLMTDNFADYTLLQEDDPFEECYGWFWATLGEDEVYPKEFLEYLQDLCDRIDRGEEEVVPLDMDQMRRIMDLVGDAELDDEAN